MESETKSRAWRYLTFILKFGITFFALYWVLKNINLQDLYDKIIHSNPIYISLAFITFILSQLIASSRINTFFKAIGLKLPALHNYKLYLLGMFYNIFLPGGIGGDGYKVYFINKHFGLETKKLIIAKFLDKLSGVWAICFLILVQILFIPTINISNALLVFFALIGTIFCYFLYQIFFKEFKSSFLEAHLKAFALQLSQIICVIFILLGLGINDHHLPYLIIFLSSAFMALFPFTIGGLGSREIVFLYGAKYFELDPQIAVTVSLIFFTISALCSLPGSYFVFKISSLYPEKNNL